MTACSHLPADPATNAGLPRAPRRVLVVDQEAARLHATAAALHELALDAQVRLWPGESTPSDETLPDVVLAHASTGSWGVASVLAANHPSRLGRPVDAFLVADGPLEKFSVLITDFPGLRLVPPDAAVAAEVAARIRLAG